MRGIHYMRGADAGICIMRNGEILRHTNIKLSTHICQVAASTPSFCDVWHLLSALEAHFAQMKSVSIQADDLEKALFVKKALVVVDRLETLKTPPVETIVAELKPHDTLIGKDLETWLLFLVSRSPAQDDVVLELLVDLGAELEENKKRALSSDDLETALAVKHAATVVARLRSHPPSATDVLIALKAHVQVVSEEWHARMHSLVPLVSLECGSPPKRSRTA